MGGGYIYLEDLAALRAIARAFAAQRLSAARIAKWKHTQADGKAGRQAEIQTYGQTGKNADSLTYKQTDRPTY